MDISSKKSLKHASEPVDDWLHNEGYYRKLAPRDPTCLFRAISEQIYSTQHYHIRVRRECVEFMRKNSHLFEQLINIPFESYLEQISCFTEWGGQKEIEAMSLLYEKEMFIFDGQKMVANAVTENGFKDTIYLCHTPQKQYESVYPRDSIATSAFCQSLVYQTLYKEVFKMPNVDETVQNMLHDRSSVFRHDKLFLKGNLEIREELATELLSVSDKASENCEEERENARITTPFPYRVAKALDPNIYRNTDFDIWHEIRREVRNSGWTRWNTSGLQVGGKCLVQVDHKEPESVETNNNCAEISGDKDSNGNTSKNTKISSVKREPTLLHGHIQEMSKNEGPVVVFIEELGEKRTLPYAALKPICPKRNKHNNNWNLNNCRRNSTYDPNQKWKRTWHSTNRKSNDSNSAHSGKNPVDGNNNKEVDTDNKTKENEKIESWDEKSRDENENSGLKTYTMETYNSCQGFNVENTIDVRPVTVLLDNPRPVTQTSSVPQNTEVSNKNSSQTVKVPANNDNNLDRGSPNVGSTAPDSMIQPLQQISLQSPGEQFYMPPPGMSPIYPMNANMVGGAQDGNPYPFPFPCFPAEPPAPGSLLDRTIRAISFSAPPSVDPNGSDLPFGDPVTLRFFYNLGLEYFRAIHEWAYGPMGQPMNIPPNYVPHGNFVPPNTSPDGNMQQQGSIVNEDENSRSMNASRQNYGPRRRNDNPSNGGRTNNGQTQMTKTFNNRKNDCQDYSHPPRNDTVIKPISDSYKPQTNLNNDRMMKDNPNGRKNGGPTSRYKKNVDGRNRNVVPSECYQQEYHEPRPIYEPNSMSAESPPFQGTKNEKIQQSNIQQIPQSPVQPLQNGVNHAPYQQANYGPQNVYQAMPYYTGEGETFYAHGPGYYPIPYMAHPEIPDGNCFNTFPPHVYPIGAENYPQPMSTVYPPYMYPQQAMFPALPPQNGQENWYPMPGQPQYMQFSPVQPSQQAPPNMNGGSPSP